MAKTILSNLAAIVQNTQNEKIRMIDIADLHDSPHNFFRIIHVEELAYTILAQGGVKDNLIVTPREDSGFEIVSGHRRKAAVQYLLDHDENISRLLPCLVQIYADEADKKLDLISMNVTTRQLSDQELWQSYKELDAILQAKKGAGEKFGRMREMLAKQLGVSSSQVSKLQHIDSSAEPAIQDAVADGTISINTANEIAKLEPEQQQALAQGDLGKVTPKAIRDSKPLTVKWDGELLEDTVRQQLLLLVRSDSALMQQALTANSTEYTADFRKRFLSQELCFMDGITISGGFEHLVISFSSPSEYENIAAIEIKWKTAAKAVRNWLKEEAADGDPEQVDTPVTFSEHEPGSPKVDTPVNFSAADTVAPDTLQYAQMPQEQRDRIFDTGCFNEIVLGYLTIALQDLGLDADTVLAAQNAVNGVLHQRNSAEARKAFASSGL